MPELTEEEIEKLRALLPQATVEEAEDIVEEASEAIEEEANEPEPDVELIEEASEIIQDAEEIIEVENEPIQSDSESAEPAPEYDSPSADDVTGGVDIEPIYASDDGADAISANHGYADDAPRATHWWYRPLRRR